MANVFETDMTQGLACDVNVLIRTDATNCATLTEKELSQHCAVVSCEHRNSTRSHDRRLVQSDCRIPKTLSSSKFSAAGWTRDSFTVSVTSPDSCTLYISNVFQTLSSVPMQLAWLARLVITHRDEAHSTLAVSCRIVGKHSLSINCHRT